MQFGRVLLLDITGQPVEVVDWQKAMLLLITNKAIVIDEYDNVLVRSARDVFKLPSILRLNQKSRKEKKVNFHRRAIFYRDNFCCGYCGDKFKASQLTLDHVLPVCQGGEKNWMNIVSSCSACNRKKGGRTPDQAGMKLHFNPYEPRWNPSMFIQIKKQDPVEKWQDWLPSLKVEPS